MKEKLTLVLLAANLTVLVMILWGLVPYPMSNARAQTPTGDTRVMPAAPAAQVAVSDETAYVVSGGRIYVYGWSSRDSKESNLFGTRKFKLLSSVVIGDDKDAVAPSVK